MFCCFYQKVFSGFFLFFRIAVLQIIFKQINVNFSLKYNLGMFLLFCLIFYPSELLQQRSRKAAVYIALKDNFSGKCFQIHWKASASELVSKVAELVKLHLAA